MYTYIIGIDPGTHTGLAVWDSPHKCLVAVLTMPLHRALRYISTHYLLHPRMPLLIRCENPNTWKPYKGTNLKESNAKLQGAGSIKRDFNIWEEFARDYRIDFQGVSLRSAVKKLDPQPFTKLTGWSGRTSVHARDAAMLCFQYQ